MIFCKIIRRMLNMSSDAWYIFIRSMQLTAFILLCAFILLLEYDGTFATRQTYMTAVSLYESGQSLLLIGAIFSVCIEDAQSPSR